jgi:hypothetical protein
VKPTRAHVRVLAGAKEDFFHRHRKDLPRAEAAWAGLISKRGLLESDTTFGDAIQRHLWPKKWASLPNLYRMELPGAFRAVYTVLFVVGEGHILRIDWAGDHKEYDRLFGYK